MTASDDTYTVPPAGWFSRAYYTPLADALKGNLSARLDVRREIAAANLPRALAERVYDVARGTRLWRNEKLEVARELIAHFQDGLASGRSAQSLAADFGSTKTAARLIRQSKLRCRPLWWQVMRIVRLALFVALGIAVLGYLWLAARFYFSQPDVSHNYWIEINESRQGQEAERAWPLYREALFKLGRSGVDSDWLDHGPAGEHWSKARLLLAQHQESLELARAGALRPRLGFLLGDAGDLAAARAAGDTSLFSQSEPLAAENKELIGVFLNGPQAMRSLSRLVALDARRAALDGDGAAVVQDYTVLIAMSDQLFQPHATLVEQLTGIAIFGMSMDSLGRTLEQSPAVLSDAELIALAHRISAFDHGAASIDFSGERMLFEDILQRIYSDDGAGRGHVTSAGLGVLLDYVDKMSPFMKLADRTDAKVSTGWAGLRLLVSPGVAAMVGSREANQELYDQVTAKSMAAHAGPAWTWDLHDIDRELKAALTTVRGRMYYLPVNMLLPAQNAMLTAAERSMQVRDGALVAIALELYHRRHDAYPQSLAELVPHLLPAVPIDRYDGRPLRLMVRDGKAVLYSVGADRHDDEGRPTKPMYNAFSSSFGIPDRVPASRVVDLYDGDWILWPPVIEEEEVE